MKLKICKYKIDFFNKIFIMCNIDKLYIKCFYDENTIINKSENIPIEFLPNDFTKEKYTLLEKNYLINSPYSFIDYFIEL